MRCDVVLEQTLGHVTHGQNLRRLLPDTDDFRPRFVSVEYDNDSWTRRVPGFDNWTIRAGVRARLALRSLPSPVADVRFVHTQVPAVLMGGEVPMVVSLDATPVQYDDLGEHYAHDTASARIEKVKFWLNRRCFDRAAHLVTWADWTKRSLVDHYGVEADSVTVIPPGVDVERWRRRDDAPRPDDGVVRILFVGGDLERKGGHDLLAAFGELRSRHGERVELHLVTPTRVDAAGGVVVHSSMTPNCPELIALYGRCDVFCLPTKGDCLPMVLPEAGSAGLALVSTDVGAIPEIVRDDDTGLLVRVGDIGGLVAALDRLITDEALRRRLAAAGNELVRQQHDAMKNANRIVDVIRSAIDAPPRADRKPADRA